MRKILCFIMGLCLILPLTALTACAKKQHERRSLYTIEAEYFPQSRTLSAKMTVDVVNPTDAPLETLSFELWPNAYREGAKYAPVSSLYSRSAYYGGESYGGISICGISNASSFEVGGEDSNILAVRLNSPLAPDAHTEIGIDFEVKLALVSHRLGVTPSTVNLANFYPVLCPLSEDGFTEYVYASCGDPFVSACADYDVTLTVPDTYTVASGAAAACETNDGKSVYKMTAENVRDVAFVLGSFKTLSIQSGETEIVYYYYKDAAPEATIQAAGDSLGYFSEAFGGYAYPRYAVVETELVYGGMEYPALSMISAALPASERKEAVVHETAHQWWYAMVGSNQFEHAWQDEGLAEYSSALFFEANPAYGVRYEDMVARSEKAYRAYFSVYSQVSGEANTAMDRALTAYSGDYEYRNLAYDKGVILFDRVRSVAGEKRTFSALKRYTSAFTGGMATPDDLISCFEKAGANVRPIFASFTEGRCVI